MSDRVVPIGRSGRILTVELRGDDGRVVVRGRIDRRRAMKMLQALDAIERDVLTSLQQRAIERNSKPRDR